MDNSNNRKVPENAVAETLLKTLGGRVTSLRAVRVLARSLPHGHCVQVRVPEAARRALGDFDFSGEQPELLGRVYEILSGPRVSRRRAGAFYTPAHVTRYIVRHAISGNVRSVLDPAAGCGAFLLEAGRRLVSRVGAANLPGHLFGMDTDADAVEVARLALAIEFGVPPERWKNVRVFDALADGEISRTFGRAKFDAVIGNPPYINVKRALLAKDVKERLRAYRLAGGQWDVFGIFIERAVSLVTDGGRFGFIIPKSALASENYEALRRLVSRENDLLRMAPAGKVFKNVGVEGAVLIGAKRKPRGAVVAVDDGRGGAFRPMRKVPKRCFRTLPFSGLSYLAGESTARAFERVGADLTTLGSVFSFKRGVEAGVRSSCVHASRKPGAVRLIAGRDMAEYSASARLWITPGASASRFKEPSLYRRDAKLLIRRVAKELIAAVDTTGAYVLNTIYVASPGCDSDIDAWCALLNSAAARRLFREAFCHDDELFPYVRISQLKLLPVPKALPRGLGSLGRRMRTRPSERVRAEIDRLVEEAYG